MAKTKTKKTIKKVTTSKKDMKSTKPTTSIKIKKTTKKKLKETKTNQKFYDQLKLNESYMSLILGSVVVVGIFAVILVYVMQTQDELKTQRVLNSVVTPTPEVEQDIYVMQEGESLWDVATRFYGDGFAYIKIAEANPGVITNPDYVPPGTEIILPSVSE